MGKPHAYIARRNTCPAIRLGSIHDDQIGAFACAKSMVFCYVTVQQQTGKVSTYPAPSWPAGVKIRRDVDWIWSVQRNFFIPFRESPTNHALETRMTVRNAAPLKCVIVSTGTTKAVREEASSIYARHTTSPSGDCVRIQTYLTCNNAYR